MSRGAHFVVQQNNGGRWTDYDSKTDQHEALMMAKNLAKHGGRVRVVRRATPASDYKREQDEYERDTERHYRQFGHTPDGTDFTW